MHRMENDQHSTTSMDPDTDDDLTVASDIVIDSETALHHEETEVAGRTVHLNERMRYCNTCSHHGWQEITIRCSGTKL